MANILQKILFSPLQCRVLDIIKDNPDSVEYHKIPEIDRFRYIIGTRHYVSIDTDNIFLSAELIKYNAAEKRDPFCSYTLTCKRNHKCDNNTCALKESPYFCCGSGFETRVYTKMLNNYIAKHGCPQNSL